MMHSLFVGALSLLVYNGGKPGWCSVKRHDNVQSRSHRHCVNGGLEQSPASLGAKWVHDFRPCPYMAPLLRAPALLVGQSGDEPCQRM